MRDGTIGIPLPAIEIVAVEPDHDQTDFVEFDLPPFEDPAEAARALNEVYAQHKAEIGRDVLANETNRKSAVAKAKTSLREFLAPRTPADYEIRFIGM